MQFTKDGDKLFVGYRKVYILLAGSVTRVLVIQFH